MEAFLIALAILLPVAPTMPLPSPSPGPAIVQPAEDGLPVKRVFVRGHTRNGRFVSPHWRTIKARP